MAVTVHWCPIVPLLVSKDAHLQLTHFTAIDMEHG